MKEGLAMLALVTFPFVFVSLMFLTAAWVRQSDCGPGSSQDNGRPVWCRP